MKTRKSFSILVILFPAIIVLSCDKFPEDPFPYDYSEKIIGKWKQIKSFDLVDTTSFPFCWDWFEVEHGFTLELRKNSTFTYTNYGSCVTGLYSFDLDSKSIVFHFDCEIEFWGDFITSITESFSADRTQNTLLFMIHADASFTERQAFSMLERVN